MRCNHLPSPGLCKVFELGIDGANEVKLLFASPAFELFFPSDGFAHAEDKLWTKGTLSSNQPTSYIVKKQVKPLSWTALIFSRPFGTGRRDRSRHTFTVG